MGSRPSFLYSNEKVYRLFLSLVQGEFVKYRCKILSAMIGKEKNVIDIGCGSCDLADYLHGSCSYLGIDLNPTFVQQARRRGLNVIMGNMFDPRNYVASDVIVAVDILHHISQRKDELIPIARRFTKKLIVAEGPWTDKARKFYKLLNFGPLRYIFRRFFDYDGINSLKHMELFTKDDLLSWLEKHDFIIRKDHNDYLFTELTFGV
ncbi:MAG: class I SAM-dependent methyltransferase [Candidatus Thorarchaeota archaeon]